MSNIKDGTRFENQLCKMLAKQGYWVHRIAQNAGGQQPADIIALRDGQAVLIDCKVCKNDRFPLSRIEDNQWYAMNRFCGERGQCYFALLASDGCIYFLNYYNAVCAEREGIKTIANIHESNLMTQFYGMERLDDEN